MSEKTSQVLKQRIEVLERENHSLKKSLYDLSARYNALKVPPYQLGELLESHGMDKVGALFENEEEIVRNGDKTKYFYEKAELKGHNGAVYTVKFSPCAKWIASGSFDKTVRICKEKV